MHRSDWQSDQGGKERACIAERGRKADKVGCGPRRMEPPPEQKGGLCARNTAVRMDLVEQNHLRLPACSGPNSEETPKSRIRHSLIEHFGCCEQDVWRCP